MLSIKLTKKSSLNTCFIKTAEGTDLEYYENDAAFKTFCSQKHTKN